MKNGPIVVYGATGFTGKLTVRALAALGAPLVVAGRNRESLTALAASVGGGPEVRVAAHADHAALAAAFGGAAVVVSCAGPFLEVGRRVAEVAVGAGAHYIDSTGEQPFMAFVMDELGPVAAAAGRCVIPAAAFEYAVADLALAVLRAEHGALSALRATYGVSRAKMSPGTRLSILRMLTDPREAEVQGGQRLTAGPRLRQRRVAIAPGKVRVATSFPGGEALFAPITAPELQTVESYMMGLPSPSIINWARTAMRVPGVGSLARTFWAEQPPPTDESRKAARFRIALEVEAQGKAAVLYYVDGKDPYGLTGEILARLAVRLSRGTAAVGATSPGAALGVADSKALLVELGVTLLAASTAG